MAILFQLNVRAVTGFVFNQHLVGMEHSSSTKPNSVGIYYSASFRGVSGRDFVVRVVVVNFVAAYEFYLLYGRVEGVPCK